MKIGRFQGGISLVEIMVALTVSLLLLGGVFQVFLSTKQTYTAQDARARLQENGRFALEVLSRELRMAGYLGCNMRDGTSVINTLNDADTLAYAFGNAVQGFGASGGVWLPPLDAQIAARSPLPGSDILTFTSIEGEVAPLIAQMSAQSAALQVPAGNAFQQGDIVVVGDCRGSSIMQITNANPGTSGTLVHNTGAGTPGNAVQDLGRIYREGAEVTRLVRRTYFIRTGQNGRPALWQYHNSRPVSGSNPAELIENVERMVIRYGVDTDADGLADAYMSAADVQSAGAWGRVISARVALLASTGAEVNLPAEPRTYTLLDTTVATTDGRARRVFDTTVTLRNRVR